MSTTVAENEKTAVEPTKLDEVVIASRDSGDGMQLTGTVQHHLPPDGNDSRPCSDFPAEIRAPQGTLPGVSAFQVRIADMTSTPRATPRTCCGDDPRP